jgi:hypothetical protein
MPGNVTNVTAAIRSTPRKLCHARWDSMPRPAMETAVMRHMGTFLYQRFTRNVLRVQSHYTHFMRNPRSWRFSPTF